MIKIARVTIWKTFVGAVAWNDENGYAAFEFDPDFLKNNLDLSPIKMPIKEALDGNRIFSFPSLNKETYKGLPGLLSDSLPDRFGNRLIDAWLAQQGRDINSFNPIERLCYIGKRGMGALEYEPPLNLFNDLTEQIDIKRLVKLAKEILSEKRGLNTNIHKKDTKGMLDILKVSTSAGGARAKAIIAYNENTGEVRSGQIDNLKDFEYWIIKFDGVAEKQLGNPKGYGKIEYAYHLMAKDCGINMTKCKLLNESNRAHFMTQRFDRIGTKRLHLQTLCAIAHFDYNDPNSYSYEQAFQIMRQLKLTYKDTEELYRRMIFNVFARNQDDHTKNISFLMDESGKWRLSPAYDITYAYDPANKWIKSHQMSINGKRSDIKISDCIELAKKMNVKKPLEIIEKIQDTLKAWPKYAAQSGMEKDQIKLIKNNLILK